MARYIGLIDGQGGAYGIHFPDLPGCTSMGATIEEAIANGADAMRLWVKVATERGIPVPTPREYEVVRQDPDVAATLREGATIATVPLIRETGKPAKANLSIDRGILEAIDAEAERRKLTRSALVEAMAREVLPRMS